MNKIAAVAALSAMLAGCGTTGSLTPATLTTTLTTVENDIVGFTRSLCGFHPTIATVAGIMTALYPPSAIALVPEQAVAQTICNALPPPAAAGRLGAAAAVYPGTNVVIHGTFVGGRAAARYRPRG